MKKCLTISRGQQEPVIIKCKNEENEFIKTDIIRGMEKTMEYGLSVPIQDGRKNISIICEIFYNITDQNPLIAKNNNSWPMYVTVPKNCVFDDGKLFFTYYLF